VRRALYQAVDIETMRSKLMNGQSYPTGGSTPSPARPRTTTRRLERAPALRPGRGPALMAEAGYAEGFEVTLDCPNNRYINDEEICIALAGMWAQIGRQGAVNAHAARDLLPQAREARHQLVHAGLGRGGHRRRDHADAGDAQPRSPGRGPVQLRALAQRPLRCAGRAVQRRADPRKREELIKAALREWKEQVHTIPLHRQVIPWAARSPVEVVHRADNWLEVAWITLR
jgi:peptide/nickel transport system substrate-binding protein